MVREVTRYNASNHESIMKRLLFSVVFVSGLLACLTAAPAMANDGPTISYLGALKPVQESVISMDKESVEFTVSEDPGSSLPAKATFWFTNPTAQDVDVESIFPMTFEGPGSYGRQTKYAENVKAKVNGVAVKGEVKFAEYPYRDSLREGELEPKKAEGYVFSFKVPAKKTIKVEVSFDAPLSYVGHLTFNYYIGSGAGWAGPIKEAKFVVHYPYRLEQGWVSTGSWYEGAGGYKAEGWGKETLQGKDYILALSSIEPDDANSVINFEIFPPASAKMLNAARQGMADFKEPWQWRQLADAYRSFEFDDGQFDAYRPRFAVDGYWLAIDKYLAAEKIDPFKPADYRQAELLAALYSDNWAPNAMGDPNAPQFYDLKRYQKLIDYLQSQKNEWWGVVRYRMENILALDKWWRAGRQDVFEAAAPAVQSVAPAAEQTPAMSQATPEQLSQIKQEAQALRDEVKNLQRAREGRDAGKGTIDPIIALLFVFGGVLAGFATVALTKRALAKKH